MQLYARDSKGFCSSGITLDFVNMLDNSPDDVLLVNWEFLLFLRNARTRRDACNFHVYFIATRHLLSENKHTQQIQGYLL